MKKEKLLDKAQKLVQKGYLDKAVVEFAAIVQLDPADISIRLRLGDLYVKLARNEDAIKEYTEVAKVHTNKGFYLKAIAVYKQIIKLNDTLEIHNKLAELYTKQRLIADAVTEYGYIVANYEKKGRTNEAFALVKKMVEIAPDNMGVRIKLAEMHLQLGFDKDALAEYKVIVEKLLSENKIDKAERIFVDIYKARRKEPMVLEGLYNIFKKKGDQEKSLRFAREFFDVCRETGDEEKAKEACGWILAINPGDKEAKAFTAPPVDLGGGGSRKDEPLIQFPDLGTLSRPPVQVPKPAAKEETPLIDINFGDLPKPAAKKEEAPLIDIKMDVPVAPEPKVEKAAAPVVEEVEAVEAVEELEELEEAVEPVEAVESTEDAVPEMEDAGSSDFIPEPAIASSPEAPKDGMVDLSKELGLDDMVDNLSMPWDDAGDGSATEEFKAGMGEQLSKEDVETHYNLGIAYMEMELLDDAIREFKLASKSNVFELDCYIRLGHCLVPAGHFDEAVSYYMKALNLPRISDMDKMAIMYDLGLAYMAGDKKEDALSMLRSVEGMDPNYREVKDKIKELVEGKSSAPEDTDDEMIEVEPI